MRNIKYLSASIAIFGAMLMAGCTPEARTDLGQAGNEVGQATDKSVQATGEVVEKAGEKVEDAAVKTAEATKDAARTTGELVGGAANSVKEGAEQAGAAVTITPAVKTALASNKQIDASTLNVDTIEDKKVVVIRGTQKTSAQKDMATTVAKKAVADAGASYSIRNEIKVAM